ncbi:MAG: hypothetical protein OQK57_00590, partial [Ignavibacteriaceae bacterium]|nr:hypothetical protein [Ignavibacteriaceae bacterium]
MNRVHYILFYIAFLLSLNLQTIFSQTDSSYLKTEEILEDILQEPVGDIDESNLYEQLELLMLNPLNLNTSTVDDLLLIPTMDISTARLIIDHRNKYGYF